MNRIIYALGKTNNSEAIEPLKNILESVQPEDFETNALLIESLKNIDVLKEIGDSDYFSCVL